MFEHSLIQAVTVALLLVALLPIYVSLVRAPRAVPVRRRSGCGQRRRSASRLDA